MNKLIREYVTRSTHREKKFSHIFFRKSKRGEFCKVWRNNIKGDLERSFSRGLVWVRNQQRICMNICNLQNNRLLLWICIVDQFKQWIRISGPPRRNIRVVTCLYSFPKPILQEITNCTRNIRDKFGKNWSK